MQYLPGRSTNCGELRSTDWLGRHEGPGVLKHAEAPPEVDGTWHNTLSLLPPVVREEVGGLLVMILPLSLSPLSSKFNRELVSTCFLLFSRALSLLIAAAPAAWDGVRAILSDSALWILLARGTTSGSLLSSLESLSVSVMGSTADPSGVMASVWQGTGAELDDVLEAILEVDGMGVSGIELECRSENRITWLCYYSMVPESAARQLVCPGHPHGAFVQARKFSLAPITSWH